MGRRRSRKDSWWGRTARTRTPPEESEPPQQRGCDIDTSSEDTSSTLSFHDDVFSLETSSSARGNRLSIRATPIRAATVRERSPQKASPQVSLPVPPRAPWPKLSGNSFRLGVLCFLCDLTEEEN